MECNNCDSRQRQFCCVNCLRSNLRDFGVKIGHAISDRDEQITRAGRSLKGVEELRARRADVAAAQNRVQDLANTLEKVKSSNRDLTNCLRTRRASIAARRRTLATARALPAPGSSGTATVLSTALVQATEHLTSLSTVLAQARTGLVQELVEVFEVVEVGGRPAIGGRLGTKGEWTIGGLVLPVPGDVRRYPPDHINAVLTHTLHFLGLLTFYLGIKLPFVVEWVGPGGSLGDGSSKLGVGTPWIGAIRGSESGNWARWHVKHPLHLSSNPATAPAPDTTTEAALSASHAAGLLPTANPTGAFTTAFAMLLYNVAYLAHTQSVDIPLASAGDVLNNLWGVCCASELGRRSHESGAPAGPPLPISFPTSEGAMPGMGALLASELGVTHGIVTATNFGLGARAPRVAPPPTPPTFPLDFAQVLQATAAGPRRVHRDSRTTSTRRDKEREKERKRVAVAEEDEWDLVEADEERDVLG